MQHQATTGEWAMEIRRSTRDGCMVIAFTGSIDMLTVARVRRELLKDLSEEPNALVCDLAGVDHLDPVCATVFSTVANHPASRWPTTSFLLCGAQPKAAETLGRLQVPHFMRLFDDVDQAIDEAVSRPPYLRDELRLAPTPTAAAAARAFVREVCLYWQIALPDATVTDRAVQRRGPRPHRALAAAGAARRPPAHRRAGRQPEAPAPGRPRRAVRGRTWALAGRAARPRLGRQPSSRRRQGRVVRPQPVSGSARGLLV
jgi:anti-anti-sigma regulatory factor